MVLIAEKTLSKIWKALPSQLGSVVGEEATLAEPELARTWAPEGRRYHAELELVEPRVAKLWMSFAMPIAIASAGNLVMRPKNAIRSNIESDTFDGDDLDAMGECVNTFCAAINDAVRVELGEDHRIVFRAGSLDAPDISAAGPLSVARGRLKLGELASGDIELVVPDGVFVATREEAAEDADEDDGEDEDDDLEDDAPEEGVDASAPAGARRRRAKSRGARKRRGGGADDDIDAQEGPLLSPEEMAAIREATSAMQHGVALVVANRASVRELWRESLAALGLEFELVADHFDALASCRTRAIDVILVDADASASRGLALLAAVRGREGVPQRRVVVASMPTHSHLVSCMAGGASEYLVRPVDDATLSRVLGPGA